MKEQFVTYDIALKLKELGFDEECFAYFHPDSDFCMFEYYDFERQNSTIHSDYGGIKQCTAPLYQQAIDWFIEKHRINCVVGYTEDNKEEFMAIIDRPNQSIDYNMNSTKSYYKAREQAILKAIKLIKNNNLK